MKRTLWSLLLGSAVCAAVLPINASAMERGPQSAAINKRQQQEQSRIRQGVRSGELTKLEARRLAAEQAKIRADEKLAKANGRLSARERERLAKELHRASRDIYRQKHDGQDR